MFGLSTDIRLSWMTSHSFIRLTRRDCISVKEIPKFKVLLIQSPFMTCRRLWVNSRPLPQQPPNSLGIKVFWEWSTDCPLQPDVRLDITAHTTMVHKSQGRKKKKSIIWRSPFYTVKLSIMTESKYSKTPEVDRILDSTDFPGPKFLFYHCFIRNLSWSHVVNLVRFYCSLLYLTDHRVSLLAFCL